ncbi:MAG: hypothetical protein JXR53_00125 [Bacteroidales bacterium]|nr:hypothetical protein [Bacteroidales bacterium]
MRTLLSVIFIMTFLATGYSQDLLPNSSIQGDFQTDFQYYFEDSLIGAPNVPEKLLSNGYLNLLFTNGNFNAGIRYENYQNVMQGFDPRYEGSGIAYRFAEYKHKDFEITVGNFYEQFGSGMVFRSYEERSLGIDNSVDGIRLKYKPFSGVYLKGFIGKQRFFFDKGPGIVRGIDGELSLNEFIPKLSTSKWRYTIGGSFVSKYQEDKDPIYKLPENVGSWAGRLSLTNGKIIFNTEYAHKINDPSTVNNLIYKDGEALLVNLGYTVKGFGLMLSAKRIDNMSYRSDRTATGNVLMINYLPALTNPHTYTLEAFYPYATQPNGEMGFQGQLSYKIDKGTLLGGKYGTYVALNYSRASSLDMQPINDTTLVMAKGTDGYTSDFFALGDELFFEDFNIEITHKFSSKVKAIGTYALISYNSDVIEGHTDGMFYANVGVLDLTYKVKPKKAIRFEMQHLWCKQDEGNWGMGMIEYSIAPKWFFAVLDNFNYGNPDKDKQLHYYMMSFGYTRNAGRISVSYGKQREGIICVGGVCRNVPASNGFLVSITSNF